MLIVAASSGSPPPANGSAVAAPNPRDMRAGWLLPTSPRLSTLDLQGPERTVGGIRAFTPTRCAQLMQDVIEALVLPESILERVIAVVAAER